MRNLNSTLSSALVDRYTKNAARVHELAAPLTSAQFWQKPFPYGNSFGHLVWYQRMAVARRIAPPSSSVPYRRRARVGPEVALNDMPAGDTGIPTRDFLAELRRKYHYRLGHEVRILRVRGKGQPPLPAGELELSSESIDDEAQHARVGSRNKKTGG